MPDTIHQPRRGGTCQTLPQLPPAPYISESRRILALSVYCRGDLTAEVTDLLRNEVKPLIPTTKSLTLDLTEIRLMDSSGLGTIVKLYVSGRTSGCTVSLVNFNRRVRELLGMTNLLRVFETCGDHTARMP